MHGSKLPLTVWSWTACPMATHSNVVSNVVSAFRRWRQLGLGSYKTAWLLSATLRSAMTDPGRIRLAPIADVSAASLYGFINANVAPAATARTDGWQAYPGMPAHRHDPHVIGSIAAHVIPPWVHRMFCNLKTWALGVYRGLRPKHLQSRLDEFVFRFNRRHISHAAFRSLLGIGIRAKPVTHQDVGLTANNGISCFEKTYYRTY